MKWLLSLLEKMGRHEVLVDMYGDIHWHRYYLLYRETPGRDWWPNVYLHIFPTRQPDGEDSHSHPWPTFGFILRHGYTELINNAIRRINRRFSFTLLRHTDRHRIIDATPGTVSLFFHGFKRAPWRFYVKRHSTLCDFCRDHNGGVCIKPEGVLDFEQYLSRAESNAESPFAKRRSMKWATMDATLKKQIARRQEALKRRGLTVLTTKSEKYDALREVMVSRNQSKRL